MKETLYVVRASYLYGNNCIIYRTLDKEKAIQVAKDFDEKNKLPKFNDYRDTSIEEHILDRILEG
jgi:hypothetical protein